MSDYQIAGKETYSFEFWRGDPPRLASTQTELFTWPGVNNVGRTDTGIRAGTFEAELVSWHSTYALALYAFNAMQSEPDQDFVRVLYNNIDLWSQYSHRFTVEGVEMVSCKVHPQLIAPTFSYAGGAELITRWQLTPHYG